MKDPRVGSRCMAASPSRPPSPVIPTFAAVALGRIGAKLRWGLQVRRLALATCGSARLKLNVTNGRDRNGKWPYRLMLPLIALAQNLPSWHAPGISDNRLCELAT